MTNSKLEVIMVGDIGEIVMKLDRACVALDNILDNFFSLDPKTQKDIIAYSFDCAKLFCDIVCDYVYAAKKLAYKLEGDMAYYRKRKDETARINLILVRYALSLWLRYAGRYMCCNNKNMKGGNNK